MRKNAISDENSATRMMPPRSPWRVKSVKSMDGYSLFVEFQDRTVGTVDLSNLVSSPNAGVFSALADRDFFRQVHVDFGVVTWPGEIDLAPDAMYRGIKEHGVWIVNRPD